VASDALSHARDLERRDTAIASDLEALGNAAERVGGVLGRASELRAALERLPGEIEDVARRSDEARAQANAAKRELVSADERVAALASARRRKQDELDRAEREATTARQLLSDAESEVDRVREQLEELRASEPRLRAQGAALVREVAGISDDLTRLPRIPDTDGLDAGETLDDLEQWGLVARSALLVARGTLEAERERLVVEANELAALVLGESLGGSSVTLVRNRLEALS
jgi:chromosome segregation ATPase